MIFPKPKTEAEEKKQHRQLYENEKQGLILFHKEMGYEEKSLNKFIVNSLKDDFETELKEDGLI